MWSSSTMLTKHWYRAAFHLIALILNLGHLGTVQLVVRSPHTLPHGSTESVVAKKKKKTKHFFSRNCGSPPSNCQKGKPSTSGSHCLLLLDPALDLLLLRYLSNHCICIRLEPILALHRIWKFISILMTEELHTTLTNYYKVTALQNNVKAHYKYTTHSEVWYLILHQYSKHWNTNVSTASK